jgi:hypothetical protein
MKKLIVFLILLSQSLIAFSQTDTSKKERNPEPVKCLPVSTFKSIAKDLLRGDSAIAELKLANEQITQLEEKVVLKDSVIVTMQKKEENYQTIIKSQDEKYLVLEDHTKKLEVQLKKEKVKNKFKTYIGGGLIAILSVFLLIQ